jgi:hypothetical protein
MNTANDAKTHERILEFIKTLKGVDNSHLGKDHDAHKELETIYSNGGCYSFAKTLQFVFPEGELWALGFNDKTFFSKDTISHVVFKFGEVFYDISGCFDVEAKMKELWGFDFKRKMTDEDISIAECFCYASRTGRAYGKRDTDGNVIYKLTNKEAS